MTPSSFLLKASLLSWAFPRAAWSSFSRVSGQLGARLIAERVGRRKKSWITRSFFFSSFFFCWQMDFCCLKVGKEFFVWTQSRQPCRWGKCFKATLQRFVNQLLRLSPSCLCDLGYINWHLRVSRRQHLHHSLPSPGVFPLAQSISMGTAIPQEGSTQKKASCKSETHIVRLLDFWN